MDEVRLDPLDQQSAPGVCDLFRSLYGDTHPQPVYDPEYLCSLQNQGRQLTWVARLEDGRVVGSISIWRQSPFEDLYTLGHAMVLPDYRGRSLSLQLTMLAATEVFQDPAAVGGLTETGSHWLKTQEVVFNGGFLPTALLPDAMAPQAVAVEHRCEHPVSTLDSYFNIRDEPQRVYIPRRARPMAEFIYSYLGLDRDLCPAPATDPEGVSELRCTQEADTTRLDVLRVGADLEEKLPPGGRVTLVALPLQKPEVEFAEEILYRRGFRPCGLLPHWFGQDALVMQKNLHPPNFSRARLHAPQSLQLAQLVRQAWAS